MKWTIGVAAFAVLFGCAPTETSRSAPPDIDLPPMKTFEADIPFSSVYANNRLAQDFLDLSFQHENGEKVPIFTRFEGEVTVGIKGDAPPTLGPDLDKLLGRLRQEAGINITRTRTDKAAITVVPVPHAQIRKVAPTAACFVRPNVSSREEYRARAKDPDTFWTRLTRRDRMAVFIPNDAGPQEMRDCLHEEIAQALGPVNDIYRLSESIFNDDNFHAVLTAYDMKILSIYYDPALRNGMRRTEVAARLPSILARVNPRGGATERRPVQLQNWRANITLANSTQKSRARRVAAAERAIALAKRAGAHDPRLAFSYYTLGRLTIGTDPQRALDAFLQAGEIYQSRRDTKMQEAHVALQIAAFQLSSDNPDIARQLIDIHLPTVRQGQNAALLSLMLLIKAEALSLENRAADAKTVKSEALAWARYGFGSSDVIQDRAAEVTAISPRSRNEGAT